MIFYPNLLQVYPFLNLSSKYVTYVSVSDVCEWLECEVDLLLIEHKVRLSECEETQ
jgi:hypothetical protein